MRKSNENLPEPLRNLRRHHGTYNAAKFLAGRLFQAKARFSYEPYRPKSGCFLLISNHTTMLDPIYLAIAFREYLRFVSSDHLLRLGAWGKFIRFCVAPIPKRRGGDSAGTVEMILDSLRCGVNVCLFAEGFCSINGETGFIPPRTGKLVKDSGAGLVTYRFSGGYFQDPRWARRTRRGPLHGAVVREYAPEQLREMTAEEVNDALRRDLYIDAYAEQRRAPQKYRGRRLAEDLETVLYICPKCRSIGTLHSRNDIFSCSCGYQMRLNEYGFFEGADLVFDNVLAWDKWQKRYMLENAEKWKSCEGVLTSDEEQIFYSIGSGGKKEVFSEHCRAELYRDRLVLTDEKQGKEKTVFLGDISKMSLGGEMKVSFTADGVYYELKSHIRRSGVKYFAFWRILTRKEYL